MSWYTVPEAASVNRVTPRHIYRLVKNKKIETIYDGETLLVWIGPKPDAHPSLPSREGTGVSSGVSSGQLEIPKVDPSRIRQEDFIRIEGMVKCISAVTDLAAVELHVEKEYGVTVKMQRIYKQELRRLFNLPSHSRIADLASNVQLRPALESIVCRKERSDRLTLASCKGFSVVMPTGELLTVEEFLKSLFPRENMDAVTCFQILRDRTRLKRLVKDDGTAVTMDELPAERTVRRFLAEFRREYYAVRKAQSREHDWQASELPYVSRKASDYKPGEMWIGDHTELDFMVMNEEGKLDRRWISTFIDYNSGLLTGYHLSWQPNSQTIALAFRAGVTGCQINIEKEPEGEEIVGKFVPHPIVNWPGHITLDNGKDYRSKHTQRNFGRIEFTDDARRNISSFCNLHFCLPYHGMSKAVMERWFGIFQDMIRFLPGYKANKYQNQPDTLKTEIKAGQILTVQEFDAAVALAINVYNNTVRSRHNTSPIIAYLTGAEQQRAINVRVLDFLMLRANQQVIRKCEVSLFNRKYYNAELIRFKTGTRADIYYDPNDLGTVSIYVDGKYVATAFNKDAAGKDVRGISHIVIDRARIERTAREQIKEFRGSISDRDARSMALQAKMRNTAPVPEELLAKTVPTIAIMTGLESTANELHREKEEALEVVEIQRRKKRAANVVGLSLDSVSNVS